MNEINKIDKLIDFFVNISGVFGGAFLAYVTAKRKYAKELKSKRNAYIQSMLYEFQRNKEELNKLKTYIMKGPEIDNLWSPAEVIADGLIIEAWRELIKAGILDTINEKDRKLFEITNNRVLDAKSTIRVISANWKRVNEWHNYDIKQGNQLLTSRQLFLNTALDEAIENVNYATERLEESISRLKQFS